jgi:hypothetical protein
LEQDLDNLLKIGEEGATTCREAPFFDKYLDSFVYWKGMQPSELLEYDSYLVALTQELPFQDGKPLYPIMEEGEGRTVLIDYSPSREFSPQHHVYMASLHKHDNDDKPGREYDDELLADVSADKRTAVAPQDEDEEHRRIRRIKNA